MEARIPMSDDKSKTMSKSMPMPLPGHQMALLLLVLAYALSIADRMIISILFVPIKTEFGLTDGQLGLLGGLSFALLYATWACRLPVKPTGAVANSLSLPR